MDDALTLVIETAGPGVSVQDAGRPGYLGQGLSRSGAVDALALAEGAALLGRAPGAAVEMAGMGGRFRAEGGAIPFALTGADMGAAIDGRSVPVKTSAILHPGEMLSIGGARSGTYGYLTIGDGIRSDLVLGSQSAHLRAGLGRALAAGDRLPVRPGGKGSNRFSRDLAPTGPIRVVETAQSHLFAPEVRTRFLSTTFRRGPRANRMGVELTAEDARFGALSHLSILSEIIQPGDIQMTGDGQPFVLGPESQTTGGYPRMFSVVPQDLGRVFQLGPDEQASFALISLDEATADLRRSAAALAALPDAVAPMIRDPHDVPDLLGQQLISGATDGEP